MSRRRPAKQISEGVWDKKPCKSALQVWHRKAKAKYGPDSPQAKEALRRLRLNKPRLPTYPHDPCIVPPKPGVTYKAVPNFPRYRVGDDGSVWSNAPIGGLETTGFRQLRPDHRGSVYLFGKHRKRAFARVAALVLSLFGHGYQDGMIARNKDNNPKNNTTSNVAWEWPAVLAIKNLSLSTRTGRPRKAMPNKSSEPTPKTETPERQVG